MSPEFSPGKSFPNSRLAGFGGEVLLVCALLLTQVDCSPAQNKGTIGAVLAQSPDGRITLREVPPELAAGKAGLQAGDELLLIDGIDVRQLDAKTIHRLLSGEIDQPIDLTLQRGDAVIRVTLKRSAVPRQAPATSEPASENPLSSAESAP
ncbi:MAG: PDZ domain-containing protein [Myxococcales bacterium]|nr:PDZ domain-containing protein [Myxococcales bacterium]